jgi:hypothetical protein
MAVNVVAEIVATDSANGAVLDGAVLDDAG